MLRWSIDRGRPLRLPAIAQPMSADEARQFVIGKLYSDHWFDGTRGAGRIAENGSVAGSIQSADGAIRGAMLPSDTLYVAANRILPRP